MAQIDASRETRSQLINYVEGFNAADSEVVGTASLGKQQAAEEVIEADRIFHVRGGYAQLPQFLASKITAAHGQILLRAQVGEVGWSPGDVSFRCRHSGKESTFRAKCAIIAVPLGVLQSGSIRITPEPRQAAEAIASMRMGYAWRNVLVFRGRFWTGLKAHPKLEELSFLFSSKTIPSTWWTSFPERTPTLTAWAGGPRADALSSFGPQEARDRVCRVLADILGVEVNLVQNQLVQCVFHDWQRDPFSMGSYSYVPKGALEASARLSDPLEETLFFAGEHTDITGHWGTVHGAMRSGLRAAHPVLKMPLAAK